LSFFSRIKIKRKLNLGVVYHRSILPEPGEEQWNVLFKPRPKATKEEEEEEQGDPTTGTV